MKYFQPADFKQFICSPACLSVHIHAGSSVCLLDGPLCHNATNGHCWASHFLNDTLLRSIQLPYSYTPHSLSCSAHAWHSCEKKKKQFLVNFPSVFSTQHASGWKNLVLSDTHTRTPAEWKTDDVWLEHPLADSSVLTQQVDLFIHSPLLILIFLIILTFLPTCVFVRLCAGRWRSTFPLL